MSGSDQVNWHNVDPYYLTALAALGDVSSRTNISEAIQNGLAVLPFSYLGGDADQEQLTDGLVEDIITALSNSSDLFVISRNTAFAFKGKESDVRRIAHDLGVQYVLEGGVRRADKRIRINVQLVDAAGGGKNVWTERYDRELIDIFEIQDDVARCVVGAVVGKLHTRKIIERRRPASLEAYSLCLRARGKWTASREENQRARLALERAISLDPSYCEAHWSLAYCQFFGWFFWGEDQEPLRQNALKSAMRALEIDPNESKAHLAAGIVLLYERRWEDARQHYEAAVESNPNDAEALISIAEFYAIIGEADRAVDLAFKAFRLNPKPPGWYYWNIGFCQIAAGRYEDAVSSLGHEETYGTASRADLITALSFLNRLDEAKDEAQLYMLDQPGFTIREWIKTLPFKDPETTRKWAERRAAAGLPE